MSALIVVDGIPIIPLGATEPWEYSHLYGDRPAHARGFLIGYRTPGGVNMALVYEGRALPLAEDYERVLTDTDYDRFTVFEFIAEPGHTEMWPLCGRVKE